MPAAPSSEKQQELNLPQQPRGPGPGPRPDPIQGLQGREPTANPAFTYQDPATERDTLVLGSPPAMRIADDPDLDAAILELKAKAPRALEVFLARAIRKHAIYLSDESAEERVVLRRVGALNVANEVDLLVRGVEQRVRERAKRDAAQRSGD